MTQVEYIRSIAEKAKVLEAAANAYAYALSAADGGYASESATHKEAISEAWKNFFNAEQELQR